MTILYVILAFLAFGAIAWLVTAGIGWLLKGAGRITHLDEKVDQFLDVGDAQLSPEDRAKYYAQRPPHR